MWATISLKIPIKLVTVDNKVIVIPNGTLANNSLTNVTTQTERRLDLKVSISYDSDLKLAKSVIEKLLREDASVLKEKEITIFVDELSDSAVIIGARCWVKSDDYWTTKWRVLENIKITLDDHSIAIPYPQMDVHVIQEEER